MNQPAIVSLVGKQLGDYQVMRRLGRGGMAEVYIAKHLELGRDVAFKVLRRDLAHNQDYIARFRREARAAAKLSHPNIVTVFDVGSIDGWHYIAQEFIDGENLREWLDRNGPISVAQARSVLVSVASALEMASQSGITHRDIKPENIMRSSRGEFKVADFGLARLVGSVDETNADLTQAGFTLGTPRYMSPEQIQGKAVDVRSDLYSLGIAMYHLLTGEPPFQADDPLALAIMHTQDAPKPMDRVRGIRLADGSPDLPEWLIAVVERLMAKLPEDRFQTASEVLAAVADQTSLSWATQTTPSTATVRLQRATDQAKRSRGNQTLATVASGIAIAALSIFAFRFFQHQQRVDLGSVLRPAEVAPAATVEEQYLIAVRRSDEPGWRSVAKHFPPAESSRNRDYQIKSSIQLARLLASKGRIPEATQILDDLLRAPDVRPGHQVIAAIEKCEWFKRQQNASALQNAQEELRNIVNGIDKNDQTTRSLLRDVIPPSTQNEWGLDL